MQKKSGLLAKFGVAAAVVAGGLTLAAQPSAAFAAAVPSYSVTPASGLSDGSSVTVAISGAAAGEEFSVVQCAEVGGVLACNAATAKTIAANAGGSVSAPFTVHKSFQASTPEGAAVGTVNCATTPCYVSAGNASVFLGSKQISFN
ncbi:enediyne antibiotic chromoprotein [Nonomuraea candida]|uniref:enediyne antibiotic chromoprotein n=1 Tax=Nonomuraea candida TaxID=359159 RepID=UPI0005BE374B|nr:enediyne antibiotic chromoprotein [Nonomuraea candida]